VHLLPVLLHPLHVPVHHRVARALPFGFERAAQCVHLLLHLGELLLELFDLRAGGRVFGAGRPADAAGGGDRDRCEESLY
jgi:hypothetical protein